MNRGIRGRQALRAWRVRSCTPQRALAAALGISNPYMCQILTGDRRPGLELLDRLETLTGIPVRLWADIPGGELAEHVEMAAIKPNVSNELPHPLVS